MSDPLQSLTAPHNLEYTYKRSLGPVLGKFFTALRDRRILGVRREDGSIMVPPKEYDPNSGGAISEMVEVADHGSVVTWAWVNEPRPSQTALAPFRICTDSTRWRRHPVAPCHRLRHRRRGQDWNARTRSLGDRNHRCHHGYPLLRTLLNKGF